MENSMIIQAILLVAGFAFLIKGADFFVDGSVKIAERLRVPTIIIGLTIVSLGTSAPEAVISITASVQGVDTLSVGNVIGSNIFNLLLAVGVCALIKPFAANLKEISKDFWVSIAAALALMLMMIFLDDTIPRYMSGIILAAFFVYMFVLIRQAQREQITRLAQNNVQKTGTPDTGLQNTVLREPCVKDSCSTETTDINARAETEPPGTDNPIKPVWQSILIAILGCGMIILGGQLTVESAVNIAGYIGITQRVVGLTVVAIGTSLPELITSVVAAKKGESGIALGNVVGSNIFNIMFVLGMAGTISQLTVDMNVITDLVFLIAVSFLLMRFVHTDNRVTRFEGLTLAVLYAGYMVYVVVA